MPILDRIAAELPVNTKLESYSLIPTDVGMELQFSSASAVSANLPPVAEVENGYNVVIRNISTGTLTIDPDGSELIDGQSTLSLATGDWHWIRSDATSWKTIASNSTELSDGSVTTAKLADNSVTGAKIAMGGDTQGDILYYDGTDYTRLAAGTSGQVLKTNGAGANPEWVDAASGGGWEFVSSATASSSATIEFTGLESGYDYQVRGSNILPSIDSRELYFRVGITGPTYRSSNYKSSVSGLSTSGSTGSSSRTTLQSLNYFSQGNSSDENLRFIQTIFDPANSSTKTDWLGNSHQIEPGGTLSSSLFGGMYTTAEANTAIQFFYGVTASASGTITSGEFSLFKNKLS